jgi:hypothetical protein
MFLEISAKANPPGLRQTNAGVMNSRALDAGLDPSGETRASCSSAAQRRTRFTLQQQVTASILG